MRNKKLKAYIFDLVGTLAYYTKKEDSRRELKKILGNGYHDQFLITKIADYKLSKEEKNKLIEILNKPKFYLYEDSERVIKKLKKNYKVGMISNIYEISSKKVRKKFNNFLKNFDILAFSSELGIMKPNPQIFIYALDRLGVRPEEAIMIGDKMERDIIPAKQLKIDTILIDRNIQTLEELI